RKAAERLEAVFLGAPQVQIEPGEAGSDATLADLKKVKGDSKRAWNNLLVHCQALRRDKPTERWEQEAEGQRPIAVSGRNDRRAGGPISCPQRSAAPMNRIGILTINKYFTE
ncbi:hypothetical protein B4Q13_22390, partial [Lacticaseibacillus rhamnosus]